MGFNPNIKPRQWGPVEQVQRAVRDYYENTLGVAAPSSMCPFWENSGQLPRPVVGPSFGGVNSFPTWQGNLFYLNGTTDALYGDVVPKYINNGASFSILFRWTCYGDTTGSGTYDRYLSNTEDNDSFWQIAEANNNTEIRFVLQTTTGDQHQYYGSPEIQANPTQIVSDVITINMAYAQNNALRARWYRDGRQLITGLFTSTFAMGINHRLEIGGRIHSGTTFGNYRRLWLDQLAFVQGALTQAQVNVWSDNPYAAIQPRSFPSYFFVSAGGAGVTVSAVDTTAVAESVTAGLGDSNVSVVDSISLTEAITCSTAVTTLTVSIYDESSLSSFVNGEIELAGISVVDSAEVVEAVSGYVEVNLNTFEEVTIAEEVVTAVDIAGINVYEGISVVDVGSIGAIGISLSIQSIETVVVEESVLGSISDLELTTADSSTLTEYALVEIGTVASVFTSVVDSTSLSEQISLTVEMGSLSVVDATSLTEQVSLVVSDSFVETYEQINVLENVSIVVVNSDVSIQSVEVVFVGEQSVAVVEAATNIHVVSVDSILLSDAVFAVSSLGGVDVLDNVSVAEQFIGDIGSVSVILDLVNITEHIAVVVVQASPLMSVIDTIGLVEQVNVTISSSAIPLSISDVILLSENVSVRLDPFLLQVTDVILVRERTSTYIQQLYELSSFDIIEASFVGDKLGIDFESDSLGILFTA